MTKESMEVLGEQADEIDNLLGALELRIAPKIHVKMLKLSLVQLRDKLRAIYRTETGDDPWADYPEIRAKK